MWKILGSDLNTMRKSLLNFWAEEMGRGLAGCVCALLQSHWLCSLPSPLLFFWFLSEKLLSAWGFACTHTVSLGQATHTQLSPCLTVQKAIHVCSLSLSRHHRLCTCLSFHWADLNTGLLLFLTWHLDNFFALLPRDEWWVRWFWVYFRSDCLLLLPVH